MAKFYITFGQRYRHEKHPTDRRIHPDGWVEVEASSFEQARKIAISFFRGEISFVYDEKHFHKNYYPKGCLFRLNGRSRVRKEEE